MSGWCTTPGRWTGVELTGLVDHATRTIAAAVLRPSIKAVDSALLLARALIPEPMRPGWADALRLIRSVLPYQSLTGIDERLEHAAARPVIVPKTIVCDHGKAYLSVTFRSACRAGRHRRGRARQPTTGGHRVPGASPDAPRPPLPRSGPTQNPSRAWSARTTAWPGNWAPAPMVARTGLSSRPKPRRRK